MIFIIEGVYCDKPEDEVVISIDSEKTDVSNIVAVAKNKIAEKYNAHPSEIEVSLCTTEDDSFILDELSLEEIETVWPKIENIMKASGEEYDTISEIIKSNFHDNPNKFVEEVTSVEKVGDSMIEYAITVLSNDYIISESLVEYIDFEKFCNHLQETEDLVILDEGVYRLSHQ